MRNNRQECLFYNDVKIKYGDSSLTLRKTKKQRSVFESKEDRRNLFDVLEDRNLSCSAIIVSQIPIENWYDMIYSPTIADAILDRLVHNSYKIELKGESMRRKKTN